MVFRGLLECVCDGEGVLLRFIFLGLITVVLFIYTLNLLIFFYGGVDLKIGFY